MNQSNRKSPKRKIRVKEMSSGEVASIHCSDLVDIILGRESKNISGESGLCSTLANVLKVKANSSDLLFECMQVMR